MGVIFSSKETFHSFNTYIINETAAQKWVNIILWGRTLTMEDDRKA